MMITPIQPNEIGRKNADMEDKFNFQKQAIMQSEDDLRGLAKGWTL